MIVHSHARGCSLSLPANFRMCSSKAIWSGLQSQETYTTSRSVLSLHEVCWSLYQLLFSDSVASWWVLLQLHCKCSVHYSIIPRLEYAEQKIDTIGTLYADERLVPTLLWLRFAGHPFPNMGVWDQQNLSMCCLSWKCFKHTSQFSLVDFLMYRYIVWTVLTSEHLPAPPTHEWSYSQCCKTLTLC